MVSADEPVARGEVARLRLHARRELRDDRALLADPGGQLGILRRVDQIGTAAKHGERTSTSVERRRVRVGVDTSGSLVGSQLLYLLLLILPSILSSCPSHGRLPGRTLPCRDGEREQRPP